jgi:hypothetical protein
MPVSRGTRRTHALFIHAACPAAQGQPSTSIEDLPDDVIAAGRLLRAGNAGAATALLHRHLDGRDYDWFPADPVLVDACTLYSQLTAGPVQVAAAAYAHRAAGQLHEPHHPRRLAAGHAYGTALHHNDQPEQAAAVRTQLLGIYLTAGLPREAMNAATDLAASQHAAGHCADAIDTVKAAWHAWRHDQPIDSDHATGVAVLRAYLLMLRGCRRDLDLLTLLHQAHPTGAIETLADSRTTASQQNDNDNVTAHRRGVCTHQPQNFAGQDAHRPVPPPISFTGYHQRDIESAVAHLLSTSEAGLLADPARTDPTTRAAAHQAAVASTAAHLAHRRARRSVGQFLAALITAAGLITLHLLT